MTEDEVLNFVAGSFASVWAVELLLFLRRHPDRSWRHDELIRELRSSHGVVTETLANLHNAGFLLEDQAGHYRYRAGSPQIEGFVAALEKLYAAKPAAVIRAVITSPSEKLRIFSDAFKFKE